MCFLNVLGEFLDQPFSVENDAAKDSSSYQPRPPSRHSRSPSPTPKAIATEVPSHAPVPIRTITVQPSPEHSLDVSDAHAQDRPVRASAELTASGGRRPTSVPTFSKSPAKPQGRRNGRGGSGFSVGAGAISAGGRPGNGRRLQTTERRSQRSWESARDERESATTE